MVKILFVCVENSCRSQIAEGFAKEIGRGLLEVYSAGSKPVMQINPDAISVMDEIGIDISGQKPKGFNELPMSRFDYVVTLGCQGTCPFVPAVAHIDWNIPDPKRQVKEFFRDVRDQIMHNVANFVEDMRDQKKGTSVGSKIQRHFDEELRGLNDEISKMGLYTIEAINKSIRSLKQRDKALANNVIDNDKNIDELELAIDEKCLDLIARHQPMASDLRFITMGMKLNAELERIADIAVDICQRGLRLIDEPELKPLIDMPKLAQVAQDMVRMSIEAFISRDIEIAKKVISSDSEADSLRNSIQNELVEDYMLKDKSTCPRAVQLLLIARFFERICDHATNIAEDVIYMIDAKVVRHHPENI